MRLIGNSMNGTWPLDIVLQARSGKLEQIDLAVAYVTKMDEIFELATHCQVPLNLYALADGHGFPNISVVRKFVEGQRTAWRLYLTRGFFHPKIVWLRGVGAYIGSANLSDSAWYRNMECGVWLPQEDLDRLNWNEELAAMFGVIHEHCQEATKDDLGALEALDRRRERLRAAEAEFKKDADRLLGKLPGQNSPVDHTPRREPGGAARKTFITEWRTGLTILQKIAAIYDDRRNDWPPWVDRDVPAAIVQDQATEWWWHNEFRRTGESRTVMVEAHKRNASNPDAAVQQVLTDWCRFDDSDGDWIDYINVHPQRLRVLLSKVELQRLNLERLEEILFLCHSSREHGRQIPKQVLGLDPDDERKTEERMKPYAEYLWGQRSSQGRTVKDVLEFVLWGDRLGLRGAKHVEDRIWLASNDNGWKLPHLGSAIFGEMIGYARPDEYPPRNNRVSKTLFALGYPGIRYQ